MTVTVPVKLHADYTPWRSGWEAAVLPEHRPNAVAIWTCCDTGLGQALCPRCASHAASDMLSSCRLCMHTSSCRVSRSHHVRLAGTACMCSDKCATSMHTAQTLASRRSECFATKEAAAAWSCNGCSSRLAVCVNDMVGTQAEVLPAYNDVVD